MLTNFLGRNRPILTSTTNSENTCTTEITESNTVGVQIDNCETKEHDGTLQRITTLQRIKSQLSLRKETDNYRENKFLALIIILCVTIIIICIILTQNNPDYNDCHT